MRMQSSNEQRIKQQQTTVEGSTQLATRKAYLKYAQQQTTVAVGECVNNCNCCERWCYELHKCNNCKPKWGP
jgi:hypothetical protein